MKWGKWVKVALAGATALVLLSGSITLSAIALAGWLLYLARRLRRGRERRVERETCLREATATEGEGLEARISKMLSFDGRKLVEVAPSTRKLVLDEETPLVFLVGRFKVVGVSGLRVLEPTPEVEERVMLLSDSMRSEGIDLLVYGRPGYWARRIPVNLLVCAKRYTLRVSRRVLEDVSGDVAYAVARVASAVGSGRCGVLTASELCSILDGGVDNV